MDFVEFYYWLQALPTARVLELGTRRSNPEIPTHHRVWAAQDARYTMSDLFEGLDVDVVADAHALSKTFEANYFDVLIACSVFEHIQRPWIAAQEIAKILKPGGKAFIQTHHTFPLHAYPHDYWRYTKEALETIFGDAGLHGTGFYEFPCRIVSEESPQQSNAAAFLNVCIVAAKN